MLAVANFAITKVTNAAGSAGTTFNLEAGTGVRFPVTPFPAIVVPEGQLATPLNAEVVEVTSVVSDVATVTRTSEAGQISARNVVAGDLLIAGITAKLWNELVSSIRGIEASLGTTAPGLVNPGTQTAQVGVPFALTLTASNATSYAVTSGALPAGLTLNTSKGLISGTPTTAETPSVTITASGPGGTTSVTFSWKVEAASAPVLTKPADQSWQVGVPVSLQVTATNTTKYKATPLPAGVTINESNGVISGTPSVEKTSTSCTVTAEGPGGTKTATFNWTVAAATPAGTPFVRNPTTSPEAGGTPGTTIQVPAPPEGAIATDWLLMLVKAEHATALQTVSTPEGWTLVGTRGALGFNAYYIFARKYDSAAMPVLTATASVEWTVRMLAIANCSGVDVNSAWANTEDNAAPYEYEYPSVTTTVANDLLLGFFSNGVGETPKTLPAGWETPGPYSTKTTFRPMQKNLGGAGATGVAKGEIFATGKKLLTVTVAMKPAAATGETITEKLLVSNEGVKPETLPVGTAFISVARCTAETGQDENTRYEQVPSTTTEIFGTVERPWVAIEALNENHEALGTYTSRLKTTPKAKVPTVTKPANVTNTQNVAISPLQLSATEAPTSYGATGLPPGLTLNTSTGIITGTPTTVGVYTVKAKASNATGASPEVEWTWTITAATTSAVTTGLASNSDYESSPSLAAIALGPASVVRVEQNSSTASSTIGAIAKKMQEKGSKMQPLAGISTMASPEQAKNMKAWAEAAHPYGVEVIEFGNETNYKSGNNNKATGETYGKRCKEAMEALVGTGVKLIVQGSDAAGIGSSTGITNEWIDGIFTAFPGIASHSQFGGWTIHSYPGSHVYGEADTFGKPMMERMVKRLKEHGDTTGAVYVTEWGVPCTNDGRTMTSGQSMTWAEGAKVLEAHIGILETASEKRMKQLLLYQNHDQSADVSSDLEREHFFGALQSSGAEKGAFTTFARHFL